MEQLKSDKIFVLVVHGTSHQSATIKKYLFRKYPVLENKDMWQVYVHNISRKNKWTPTGKSGSFIKRRNDFASIYFDEDTVPKEISDLLIRQYPKSRPLWFSFNNKPKLTINFVSEVTEMKDAKKESNGKKNR